MNRQKSIEQLMNCMNVLILLVIALIYVVTGTGVGDDAIAALSSGTIYQGAPGGAVALECAVTWDAAALPDMLDALEQSGTKITFFVSGRWARAHAATLRRMAEAGHEIGTSGYSPLLDGDAELVEQDLAASVGIIEGITGTQVLCYHSGYRNRAVSARAAGRQGLRHVSATVDLLCGRDGAEEIVNRASNQLFDGSILLLQPTAAAAEALPQLLSVIREKDLAVTTVAEVLKGTE